MKKYFYILGITVFLGLSACSDYLERDLVTDIDEELANSLWDYSRNRVHALYTQLPSGFFEISGAMIASASDEAEHTIETSRVHDYNRGSWNPISNAGCVWPEMWQGIRHVNLFLENTGKIDLENYRLDPREESQIIYQQRIEEIARWEGEARFLRAFYYFELIKRYGGVPIITNALNLGDNVSGIQRNTLFECVNFIVNECDDVAGVLPEIYPASDLGRATSGAALALKAKVLLYAASDLWNDSGWAGGYSNPGLISLPAGDRNVRWQAAADAAKAVIDLPGTGYTLATNYRNMFLGGQSYQSSEHILVRRHAASNNFEVRNYSVGFDMGESGTTPSQNLVDAYEVLDGGEAVSFDWNNPAHASDPYTNRDPRLGLSVIVNNSTFKGRIMEMWDGGRDGPPTVRATRTGYYLKKYVDETINLLTGTTSVHSWVLIRLADVYLWYAEALNEYDPGNPDIKIYVDMIRQRPGIEMPPLPSGLTQAEMREAIHRERKVELAFEGHRFWDVRRWMTASTTLGSPLRRVSVTQTGPGSFTYSVGNIEEREFEPKMYFYPIPQAELLKMQAWQQNPLW
jgi:starch-binding outer membrane protein, SusD/RagB family